MDSSSARTLRRRVQVCHTARREERGRHLYVSRNPSTSSVVSWLWAFALFMPGLWEGGWL